MNDIGRNDPCHCGSGKKYKKCHLEKDEAAGRKVREKAALNAAEVAASESAAAPGAQESAPAKKQGHEKGGWMSKVAGKVGFFRTSSQRRAPPANKGG
jgi:hypothetical protein